MGRSGAAQDKVQEETGCKVGDVRHSTIVCGLKNTVKNCYSEWLLPVLQDVSQKSGKYSYAVSIVANAYIIRHSNAEITSWQTFYNQIWTAVEGGANEYTSFVSDFFDLIAQSENVSVDAIKERIGEKLQSFEYRQNETAQMKRNVSMHFELFRSRLQHYLKVRAIEVQLRYTDHPVVDSKVFSKLVYAVLSHHSTSTVCTSAMETAFVNAANGKLQTESMFTIIAELRDMIAVERFNLGTLLDLATSTAQNWFDATKKEKRHYLLLPHLQRYSNYALAWWDRNKDAAFWHPVWKDDKNRPKCFSLLPICQMRPRMVHYSWTQLEQIFKVLPQNPLFDAQQRIEKELATLQRQQKQIENPPKKRKRQDSEVELCEQVKENLLHAISDKIEVLQIRKINARVDLMTELFDLRMLKGKYKNTEKAIPDWRVCEFATDGVQLSLTFISGTVKSVPNMTCLAKKGYDIPVPTAPIDVWYHDRGVYHIKEGIDMDNLINTESTMQNSERIVLRPVDPGCCKPIQSASITLSECTDVPAMAKAAVETEWHITEEEWKRESGRGRLERIEAHRRRESSEYDLAIKALREQRKKCADDATFMGYCKAVFKHFDVLTGELINLDRSKIRWAHCRRSIGFIARIADRLFNRETVRFKRAVQRLSESDRASSESRANLRASIDQKRSERCGNKYTVLFGDGMFQHQKGHIPIPKKSIVKALASRGLVFLVDEFNTSKMCPCGQCELCDIEIDTLEGARLRCHKTTGPEPCCVLDAIGQSNMERDILAVVNICHCGACALQKKNRPPWLCRLAD